MGAFILLVLLWACVSLADSAVRACKLIVGQHVTSHRSPVTFVACVSILVAHVTVASAAPLQTGRTRRLKF